MMVEKAVERLSPERGDIVWKLYEKLNQYAPQVHQQYKDLGIENKDLYLFDGMIKTKNFILIDFSINKECTVFYKVNVGLHLQANILLENGFANRTLYSILEYEQFTSISSYNIFCTTLTNKTKREDVVKFNTNLESSLKEMIKRIN
jgi:hypothetical protein